MQETYTLRLEEAAASWEAAYRLASRVLLESGIAAPIHPGIATEVPLTEWNERVVRHIHVAIGDSAVTRLEINTEGRLKRHHPHVIVGAVLAMVAGDNRRTVLQRALFALRASVA